MQNHPELSGTVLYGFARFRTQNHPGLSGPVLHGSRPQAASEPAEQSCVAPRTRNCSEQSCVVKDYVVAVCSEGRLCLLHLYAYTALTDLYVRLYNL